MAAHGSSNRVSRKHRRKARRPEAGQAPGTLVGTPGAAPTTIRVIGYGPSGVIHESAPAGPGDLPARDDATLWIDVQGLADVDAVRRIGERFALHPLAIADIVHTHQRPKTEIYDGFVLVVLRRPVPGAGFDSEQISFVMGDGFMLTFQERHGDCFDPVRERLRQKGARIMGGGSGYLLYALIDALVDAYFPVLEQYGDMTEALEQRVIEATDRALIADIHLLKRELLDLRRVLWPQREAINALLRDNAAGLSSEARVYLRDCADHCFQQMDTIDIYREVAQGLVDLHMSSVGNKMNEVMKVLTVISTVFMPMTFIAGVYGMNFDTASPFNLPELGWRFGYPIALAAMALSGLAMAAAFWRSGWIHIRLPWRKP
jgi:magnesium transporter